VSIEPALRIDVIRVNEQLNRRIASREAKEYGVCSVRRELYSQVFGMKL
jgi:dynein light intermediate chain